MSLRFRLKDIKIASAFAVLYSFIIIFHIQRFLETKRSLDIGRLSIVNRQSNDGQIIRKFEQSLSVRDSQMLESVVKEIILNRNPEDNSVLRPKRFLRAGVGLSENNGNRDKDEDEDEIDIADPPGHMGKPVDLDLDSLTDEQYKLYEEGWKNNSFNQYVSDMIPLDRELPDNRYPECRTISYDWDLPLMSVIICFHNEAWSTLLRTVHSVLKRTPSHLLKEIILVDDFSTMDHLKDKLTSYIAQLPKVRLIRTSKREGLIRARLLGTQAARAEVLTFLDSHCECLPGWAEPLLSRVDADPTIVTWPSIPSINKVTFETASYIYVQNKGGFYWDLHYRWISLTSDDLINRTNSDPIRSPTMPGGLFTISKKFFEYLGTYDPHLEYWGGENMELSFKIWMCGGSIELIPCSRVGHVYRDVTPMTYDLRLIAKNSQRVAEVWMDEYKDIYYENKGVKYDDIGNLQSRHNLRKQLRCKTFDWYIKNIIPNVFLPTDVQYRGKIHPLDFPDMCLDTKDRNPEGTPVFLYQCAATMKQNWYLTSTGEVRTSMRCLDVGLDSSYQTVCVDKCHGGQGNQYWEYNKNQQLQKPRMHGCLSVHPVTMRVFLELCDPKSRNQKWTWEPFKS